jgi:biotin operon repressor
MSIEVMKLVYQARLGSATRKAVAARLANYAQDDGTQVYPSLSRIAKETELSKSTVQRAIRDLRLAGVLVVVEEGGGGPRSTTKYRFDLAKLAALPRTVQAPDADVPTTKKGSHPDHGSATEEKAKVVTVPRKVVTVTQKGSHRDHRFVIEPLEPSLLSEPSSDEAGRRGQPRKRAIAYSEAFNRFWKAYPNRENNSKLKAWQEWRKMAAAHEHGYPRNRPFPARGDKRPTRRCAWLRTVTADGGGPGDRPLPRRRTRSVRLFRLAVSLGCGPFG